MLQDNQFELGDIARVYPVFRCLTNKVLLVSSSRCVTLCGIPTGSDEIIQSRELHNKCIVVILEEWLRSETRGKDGFELPLGLFL